MSETKPTEHAEAAHDDHPVTLEGYMRICGIVFSVALVAIGCMVWISFLAPQHYSWTFKVALILLVAACNAFMVAGYLMHLLSEKKLVYTVLTFTVFFVIGLAGLTLWAMQDFPVGTATPVSVTAH